MPGDPIVGEVLYLPDTGQSIQPVRKTDRQHNRYSLVDCRRAPVAPSSESDGPRSRSAFVRRQAEAFWGAGLLIGDRRHAAVAVEPLYEADRPRSESSSTVEDEDDSLWRRRHYSCSMD